MEHQDGDDHVGEHAEGGDTGKQSDDEAEPAEELRRDGEERKERGNVQRPGKEAHRSLVTVSPEPSQHLLRTVREEDYADDEAKDGGGNVAVCSKQFKQHEKTSSKFPAQNGRHRA